MGHLHGITDHESSGVGSVFRTLQEIGHSTSSRALFGLLFEFGIVQLHRYLARAVGRNPDVHGVHHRVLEEGHIHQAVVGLAALSTGEVVVRSAARGLVSLHSHEGVDEPVLSSRWNSVWYSQLSCSAFW